uniref:Putative c-type lectin n=2 Tax=Nyssomyia neivai TaxID=330878 RepID=A0A1L8DQA2_9DIPT
MLFRFVTVLFLSYISFCQGELNAEYELTGKSIYISKIKKNWFDSVDYCKNNGYELATIENEQEDSEIINALNKEKPDSQIWIGGFRHPNEHPFRWVINFKKIDSTVYTNWQPKQPNYSKNEELCLEYWNYPAKSNIFKWNDRKCALEQIFICENRNTKPKKNKSFMEYNYFPDSSVVVNSEING